MLLATVNVPMVSPYSSALQAHCKGGQTETFVLTFMNVCKSTKTKLSSNLEELAVIPGSRAFPRRSPARQPEWQPALVLGDQLPVSATKQMRMRETTLVVEYQEIETCGLYHDSTRQDGSR